MKRLVLLFLLFCLAALGIKANHPTPYMQKGASYIAKNNYAKAIKEFDRVIDLFCEYGAAYDYRCFCNIKSGNIPEAVSDLVRALRTGKERSKTGELFTLLSGSAGGQLIEALREECRINPYNRNLYYYLGLAYQDAGMDSEAAEAFAESSEDFKGIKGKISLKAHFQGKDGDSFGDWVRKQMIYPEIAKANELDGSVTCTFWIDEEGNISGIRVVDNVHYDLDSQLVKAISRSPKWTPAMSMGQPVKSLYRFTMNYKLW